MQLTRRGRALRVLIAVLSAWTLPACIGVGYLSTAHQTGLSPDMHRPFIGGGPREVYQVMLEDALGEPDERSVADNGDETWTYDRGLRWNGALLFAVIPVPLLVPVGRNRDTYHIRDNEVIRVDRVATSRWHAVCGMLGSHTGGCEAATSLSP
jgi:hypothetical protein